MSASGSTRWRFAGLAAGIVLVAFAAHRYQLEVGFVGHDTLPVILTSRVGSWAELAENFTSKFMEERFELDYYRPILNLSAALDEALFGLGPRGYQRHSIALLGAAGVALFWLARRALARDDGRDRAGSGAWIAPLCGALFFVLHSSHVSVLPIVARRHETLAALFTALALAVHLSPSALALRRPLLLPGLLTLLAMGSKETALALPALAFAAVLLYSPRAGLAARLTHAAVATAASWLALAVALAARFAILGGMGGPPDRELALHPGAVLETLWNLFLPQEPMRVALGGALVAALVATIVATVVVGAARASRTSRDREHEPGSWAPRAFALGALWMLGAASIHSLGGTHQPWYELLPLCGLALVLAAALDGLLRCAWTGTRTGSGSLRGLATTSLALLFLLLGWQLRYSPLIRAYPEWEKADRLLTRFLDRVEPLVEEAAPGSTIKGPSIPARLVDDRPGARVTDATILTHRSVQAWAELVWPERRIRVARPDEAPRPRRDEVVVIFRRLKNVAAEDVGDRAGS